MITPRNMADSAKTHVASILITESSAAGADVADVPFFRAPKDIEVIDVGVITRSSNAVDTSGCAWLVEVGDVAIATKTYSSDAASPAKGVYGSLGAIINANQPEGSVFTYSLTAGATAVYPESILQLEYIIKEDI